MRQAIAIVVILLGAGCVQAPELQGATVDPLSILPVERYTGAILETLDVELSDGETIHATVYLPEGAAPDARFGTILQFSPYFDNLYRISTDGLIPEGRDFNQTGVGMYLAHGFAYVAASVPGTGLSSGCFVIGGEAEQRRMTEFVEWIAQQPWSNGNVGMMGVSYDGTTPWEVAIHKPAPLKTIVPIAGISDMYRYEYQDGAPYAYWGLHFLPDYLLTVGWGIDTFGIPPAINPQPALVLDDACPDALPQFTETYKTWIGGQHNAFWAERNFSAKIPEIDASVLLVHGLVDWNVKPDHANVWDLIPTEKHGWFGQWPHARPNRNYLREEWSRPDWNATTLAWFDHYLNGVENGVPEKLPAVWAQDTDGRWVTSEAWPPAQAEPLTLYLQPGGFAAEPADAEPATIVTPPEPAPYGFSVVTLGPDSPPMTFAMYLSEPMERDLRLAGAPEALLHASVDRPGHSYLVTKLYNVSEDGTWWFLDEGGRGLAQRNGREKDEDVRPGEVMAVPVQMHTTMGVIHKGERLALLVAARDASWFDFNGNAPVVTLYQDAQRPSALTIPVLPADEPVGLAPDEVWATNPFYAPGVVDGPAKK